MKKNIDSLDGLRAFACLLVVFGHLAKEEIILDIKGAGQLGVMLFFVLSGFLMAHLYGREKITGSRLLEYTIRRSFRIFPAYIAVLFISYLLSPYWADFPYLMDITGFVSHLKLQGYTSVFWTIPVEVKFYVFFPVLWLVSTLVNRRINAVVFMCLLFLVCINTFPLVNSARLDLSRYVSFFIGGVCVGFIHSIIDIKTAWQKQIVNFLFIISLALILVFIPQVFLKLTGAIHPMWNIPQVLATLFAICVLTCANTTGWAKAIFSNKIFMFLGKISFSLYLVHYPFIYFFNHWSFMADVSGIIKILLALSLSIAFAYFMYYTIESPFRRWGAILNDAFQKKFI